MLLYQFDTAVSRGFYMERFQKREEISGFGVRGSGFRVQGPPKGRIALRLRINALLLSEE